MALAPHHKVRLRKLAGRSLAAFTTLVKRTSHACYDPPDTLDRLRAAHPAIVTVWHGQFTSLPAMSPTDMPARGMVARHTDADIIAYALETYPHLGLIRGAGAGSRRRDRGGSSALRAALRTLAEGNSLVMTADVPPGPARHAGLGVVTIARLSGRPILPLALASSRYISFNSWSRLTVNLPFSRLGVVLAEPIEVPPDADAEDLERARLRVEQALNSATARAYALAGADPKRAMPVRPAAPGEATASPPPGLRLRIYRAFTTLVQPGLPLLLQFRARQGKEDPARRNERLGRASTPRPSGRLVWLHAASVGETNAVLPLLDALADRMPRASFLLTTGTRTSAELAGRRLGPRTIHQYVPVDTPAPVRSFLDHWQPDLGIFTESEIWPNLVLEAAARGIPLAIVNARMSSRSYGRWRRNRGMARQIFGRFSLVLAQNEKLARRFSELGAPQALAVGNLKIDAPPPPVDQIEFARLKQMLSGRPLLLAASTHEGEDAVIAAAHRRLRQDAPGFCTIIAPRHPERGPAIFELMRAMGLKVAQRSLGTLPGPDCDIYIADTIGELGTLYALVSMAFIGGSLVEHGGQNPIEAVRHDVVVLTGPHHGNFADPYSALLRQNGAIVVRNADEVAMAVLRLTRDETELARMRAGAAAALQSLSGALLRTVETLVPLLPAHSEL